MIRYLQKLFVNQDLKAPLSLAWEQVDGSILNLAEPGRYEYKVTCLFKSIPTHSVCIAALLEETCIQFVLPEKEDQTKFELNGTIHTAQTSQHLMFEVEFMHDPTLTFDDVAWSIAFRGLPPQ